MTTKIIKELSIQIHLSGLSFCISNRTLNTIDYLECITFENRLTPFDLLNKLKAELSSKTIFSDDFTTVQLIHHNELSTLVPANLYDESSNADYLKFNSKILKTDFITTDEISSKDIINVYVPYVNINNYIFETFGTFTYKHASTLFIEAVIDQNLVTEHPQIYIDINENTMLFLVVSKGDIILYNHFEFNTAQDFIYYILFTVEQLQLDTETVQLYLSGTVSKNDDLYAIAYKYIRHVLFNDKETFNLADSIIQKQPHHNFIIKHSF